MKTKLFFFIACIISLTSQVNAHPSHGTHQKFITQADAILYATEHVNKKIEAKELDSIWANVKDKTAVLVRLEVRQIWKVSLREEEGSDKVLNVYLTKSGELISIAE